MTEKLHEILISEDEAFSTLDIGDRYVVEPAFKWWQNTDKKLYKGKKVPEDFIYSSGNNENLFEKHQMKSFLKLMVELLLPFFNKKTRFKRL